MIQTFAQSGMSSSVMVLEGGAVLFDQEVKADCFYVVLSGSADIYLNNEMVTQCGPESVLGAEPLFSQGGRYLYTVKSSGRVRASRYLYPELLDMLGSQPGIFKQMLDSFCGQLQDFWTRAGIHTVADPELYFMGDVRSFGPNQWIIREGEGTTDIFRIVSAEKGLEVSRGGHKLALLQTPGDFFGEMAAVLGEKRTASIRSLGDCILEVYPDHQLQNILADYPGVSMRIIKNLSGRLDQTTRALTGNG